MTTVCTFNQNGNLASYHWHGIDSPFGDLICRYLEEQDIPSSSGACFLLLRRVRIKPDQMPNCVGFGMSPNVITFVNLLLYFCSEDLAYWGGYPLSIINRSKGLLNEGTMERAINVAVKRGNVVEVLNKVEGQPTPAYKRTV